VRNQDPPGAPQLLVIGEALVDVVHGPGGDSYAHPGGSPANVAVGAARLELVTALLTRLGRDEPARVIAEHLARNGVQLIATIDDLPTNVAEARVDGAGQARYDLRVSWDLPSNALAGADMSAVDCVHVGSIAATLSPGAAVVHELASSLHQAATISFDPNCRPSQMGPPDDVRDQVEALVAVADVVKASDEDLAYLYPGRAPSESAQSWLADGPALVVLTSGAAGCTAWTARGEMSVDAPVVDVADTVGAGDAFTSALLTGLGRRKVLGAEQRSALRSLGNDDLRRLLTEATTAAAITCTRP